MDDCNLRRESAISTTCESGGAREEELDTINGGESSATRLEGKGIRSDREANEGGGVKSVPRPGAKNRSTRFKSATE